MHTSHILAKMQVSYLLSFRFPVQGTKDLKSNNAVLQKTNKYSFLLNFRIRATGKSSLTLAINS